MSVTAQRSLLEWAVIIGTADQSRWLKKYNAFEIGELLLRHQPYVVALDDDDKPAGLAIAIPQEDGDTIHIAFIVAFVEGAMAKFQQLLKLLYPSATHISYLRRHDLGRTSIENLARMKPSRGLTQNPALA